MSIPPKTPVRLKDDPSRAGILGEGRKQTARGQRAKVKFSDGRERWLPLSALEPIPDTPTSPEEDFTHGRFVEPDWLRRKLIGLRITGRLSKVVYSMEATETDYYAYQFKPVIKLINSPTDALLIADEVGLGKTIEAGLSWTELRARLDCDRLLIICPKTLCQKWQEELANRFGVQAQIGDAQALLKTLENANSAKRGYALICSMQGLRPPRGWENDHGENESQGRSSRRDLARFLDDASDGEPLIDLLVVDEAHHMRNPETLLNRFVSLVNSVSSHRLYLSATPIHLRNRDLHSLLKMVDPDTFAFESTVNDLIATNAPIIAARDLLLDPSASIADIIEQLNEAQQHDVLQNSMVLKQIKSELCEQHLNNSKRSEIATRLERVNQLANYVTRTRRRDVQEFRVVREPKAPILEMNAVEQCFYRKISEAVSSYALDKDISEPFLLSSPQRLLTSSLAGASAYWSGLVNSAEYDEEFEEADYGFEDRARDERPLVAQLAKLSHCLDMTEELRQSDTKYQLLLDELRRFWCADKKAKIVIFSSFKPTLHYLRGRFLEENITVELLHGSVSSPRAKILARFREEENISILLSSEVGSEGIDLQFASVVVNYDLPWNPMRLEQRIGRVDRLGQNSKKIIILNLIYDNTIDRRIYERLYERLQISHMVLGDMEAILGEQIREMTKELLNPKLSDDEKRRVVDQTAQALENKRQEEVQLESEAGSLVQHGDYILQNIAESRELRRWIRATDILVYVRDRVQKDFPGSIIETSPVGSDSYRIELSPEGEMQFQNYLTKHGFRGYTRLLSGDHRQRFRFTSSVVQKDGRVENISQLHPLVRFVAHLDDNDTAFVEARAVAASVSLKVLPEGCLPGVYALAARYWSGGSSGAGGPASIRIGYAGANAETGEALQEELAEQMMAAAVEHGRPIPNAGEHAKLVDASWTLREVVEIDLDKRFEEFEEQIEAETEDRFAIQCRALHRHFESKIENLEAHKKSLIEGVALAEIKEDTQRARRLKSLVSAQKVRIEKLRQTWRIRKQKIETQRKLLPQESAVGYLFLQVEG